MGFSVPLPECRRVHHNYPLDEDNAAMAWRLQTKVPGKVA
jgi:hypothetical protein